MSYLSLRLSALALASSLALLSGCGSSATPAAAKTVDAAATAAPAADAASAPEVIRATLNRHFDKLPAIDSVEPSGVSGLWEVRMGTEVVYTDATGEHIIKGEIIEAASKRNLTEERVAKLSAIDFASLPLKDAIVWKSGTGARKVAVFADPNCGYCKRFEQSLQGVKDVTVYTFLYPILGGDSPEKSQSVWCAKDRAAAWNSWMRDGAEIPKNAAPCDTPLARNLEFGRKHRVNGTPAVVFEDGTRVPGAIDAATMEMHFQKVAKKS